MTAPDFAFEGWRDSLPNSFLSSAWFMLENMKSWNNTVQKKVECNLDVWANCGNEDISTGIQDPPQLRPHGVSSSCLGHPCPLQ